MKRAMLIIACALVAGCDYSTGYRDGKLQKVSVKGWIWKTTECELATSGLRAVRSGNSSTTSNVWEFTVSDPAVKAEIEKLSGDETVRVHYTQHFMVLPWEGSTSYFATKVERIN